MKKFMLVAVAVLAMSAMAETVNMVKVPKFHQSYPYSGKATVEYTVGVLTDEGGWYAGYGEHRVRSAGGEVECGRGKAVKVRCQNGGGRRLGL